MAGQIPDLIATERAGTGKGAARQARRENLVPGVVYGGGAEPIAINIKFNELLKRLKAGRFLSTLFNLQVEGHEDVRVICRGVQRDVVKDLPIHVDLMRLRRLPRRGNPYWYEIYTGPNLILFGHTPGSVPRAHRHGGKLVALGLDTGCVYGGKLTAYCPETDEFAQVSARRAYAKQGRRPH